MPSTSSTTTTGTTRRPATAAVNAAAPVAHSTMTRNDAASTVVTRSRPRVQLEDHVADLHLVARLEAGVLERPDHADARQTMLHVGHGLLVVRVVARQQPL